MISLKKLPSSEKPYEKLEMYGEKVLSNSELLAILIKTGTKDKTAIELAQNILSINPKGSLRELQNISLEELKKIKGIGRVKAIQIKAACEIAKRMQKPLSLNVVIKKPEDVASVVMDELRFERKEIVKLLILNTKNVLQKMVDISIGRIDSAEIDMRKIMEEIIKTGMQKFILVHNHPSGNSNPSNIDIQITEKMDMAAKILGLQMLDHIIIGDGTFYSIYSNKRKEEEAK
ncbi:MAG: DNA repair protein RadC [Clostridia bacterium]|nr:DNA repair protein RadC [Clostridia bacterium]